MFNSIFADYNEEVRQAHIREYGRDINKMTPADKEKYLERHRVFINQK